MNHKKKQFFKKSKETEKCRTNLNEQQQKQNNNRCSVELKIYFVNTDRQTDVQFDFGT